MKKNSITTERIVYAILFWLMSMAIASVYWTVGKVIEITPQFTQMQEDIEDVEEWQKDWERNWELPADVKQTENIEFVKQYISDLKARMAKAEERITQLEISSAGK